MCLALPLWADGAAACYMVVCRVGAWQGVLSCAVLPVALVGAALQSVEE
jgi:hypothetical protein